MSLSLSSLPEQELLMAVLTKMSAPSFARLHQASKDVHEFLDAKSRKFHVRAHGCFDVAERKSYDLPGFVLESICITNSTPHDFQYFTEAADLQHLQPLLDRWTGRVLKIHPDFPLANCAVEYLQPKVVVARARDVIPTLWQASLELLVSDAVTNEYQLMLASPKILLKQLDSTPLEAFPLSSLKILLTSWWWGSHGKLRIFQAAKIEATSLGSLAVNICQTEWIDVEAVRMMDGEKLLVLEMTSSGRAAVAAFWTQGDGEEGSISCKIYLDFEGGNLTQQMLTPDAIFDE